MKYTHVFDMGIICFIITLYGKLTMFFQEFLFGRNDSAGKTVESSSLLLPNYRKKVTKHKK